MVAIVEEISGTELKRKYDLIRAGRHDGYNSDTTLIQKVLPLGSFNEIEGWHETHLPVDLRLDYPREACPERSLDESRRTVVSLLASRKIFMGELGNRKFAELVM